MKRVQLLIERGYAEGEPVDVDGKQYVVAAQSRPMRSLVSLMREKAVWQDAAYRITDAPDVRRHSKIVIR